MLKTALGDRGTGETDGNDGDGGGEEVRSGNEEMLSQHSDSVMEYGPKKPRPGFSTCRKAPYRSHSLSPSSVNKHRQLEKEKKRQHKSKGTDSCHFQAKVHPHSLTITRHSRTISPQLAITVNTPLTKVHWA